MHLPDIKQRPQLSPPLGGSGAGSAPERGSRGGAARGRGRTGPGAGGGSIVFYKEQETSLKEDMKGTLKQMQISRGHLAAHLPAAPTGGCRAGGREGRPGGTPRELPFPPGWVWGS